MSEHVHRVFYDRTTGQIRGWEYTNAPREDDTHGHIDVDAQPGQIRPDQHKVDLATLTVRPLTPEEIAAGRVPTSEEIKQARVDELAASDWRMAPDAPGNTASWARYRQAIRELPNAGDHLAQLRAWPPRPDGVDPVQHLRTRLP